MKTLKTMILSVGAMVLLGATYARQATAEVPLASAVQNIMPPAGEFAMPGSSASHDLMSIGNPATCNHDVLQAFPAGQP